MAAEDEGKGRNPAQERARPGLNSIGMKPTASEGRNLNENAASNKKTYARNKKD
jgi:hypothetical protein